ncbi:MAG: alpha/beta hydrolase [Sphingobacterium sp.]
MKELFKAMLLLFLGTAFTSAVSAQPNTGQTVMIEGKKMAYKTNNLTNRKAGEPILVFEAGLGGGIFDPILPLLPSHIASIQYERSGIGGSEPDSRIVTDSQVVARLHDLLQALAIQPPYLLVGHSMGGPYIRLFAAQYPDEVCGLVFSDPTDFMLTEKEDEHAKVVSQSKTSYQQITKIIMEQMSKNKTTSAGAHIDAARALASISKGYFHEYRSLPQLKKEIAATVIISYNKNIELPDEELNRKLNLGINFKAWWKEYDELRIQHYAALLKDNDSSMLVLLPKYSHGIYYQNPQLVAKLIQDNFNSYKKE